MTDPSADAAFAAFLAAERPGVQAFLRRLAPDDSEDLAQETCARAWTYRHRRDPGQNGRGWLLQIAFRVHLDHRRRRQRDPQPADEAREALAPHRPCPTELADELQRALRRLSPLERTLLLAFHAERRSIQELAAQHGLPANTVKSHLHRARQKLAEEVPDDS